MLKVANIDSLPAACFQLMRQLHDAPPSSKDAIHTEKALVVDTELTATIVALLSWQAKEFVQDPRIRITGSQQRDAVIGREITHLIHYYGPEDRNQDWMPPDSVLDALHAIVSSVKSDWERASSDDRACLSRHWRDTQKSVFKRKNEGLPVFADLLIRFLSEMVFGPCFDDVCDCDCQLFVNDRTESGNTLFLFVDETRLSEVDAFFGFGLSGLSSLQ